MWKPNTRYRAHRSWKFYPIVSLLNTIHTSHPISLRAILMLSSHTSAVIHFSFSDKNFYAIVMCLMPVTAPPHFIVVELVHLIISLKSTVCYIVYCRFYNVIIILCSEKMSKFKRILYCIILLSSFCVAV